MNRPLPHTWRRTAFWLLSLGLFWVSLPRVTPSNEYKEICKAHAEGKFQIRAMTYTDKYFYLVSSTGALFVEDVHTFKTNLKATPPIIHLNNPQMYKLSPDWNKLSHIADYADPKVQFAFIFKFDDDTQPILTMVKHSHIHDDSKSDEDLQMCIYLGYQMHDREEPLKITVNSVACKKCLDKYNFWLNFKLSSMLPVNRNKNKALEIEINKNIEELYRKLGATYNNGKEGLIGTIKSNRDPQSGLYVENVGIFLTTKNSMVVFITYPNPSQMKNKEWPIQKFLKLSPCETFFDNFSLEKGAFLGFGALLLALLLFCVVDPQENLWREPKEAKKKGKKKKGNAQMQIKIFSSVFSSTIHNSVPRESPQSPENAEPKKISKKISQMKSQKKGKTKGISVVKVRESQIKSPVVATSKRSQKRSQVVSSGVSSRSAVSSAITELRKSLVSLKRSSIASSLRSRMSLGSSATTDT